MDDKARENKIREALDRIGELHIRMGNAVIECRQLLESEPTTGERVRELMAFWKAAWRVHYNKPGTPEKKQVEYLLTAKDAGGFRRLLGSLPVDEVKASLRRYLEDREDFYVRSHHPLNLFFKDVNRYRGVPQETDAPELVLGCQHTPPCRSDAEHTQLKMREVRRV